MSAGVKLVASQVAGEILSADAGVAGLSGSEVRGAVTSAEQLAGRVAFAEELLPALVTEGQDIDAALRTGDVTVKRGAGFFMGSLTPPSQARQAANQLLRGETPAGSIVEGHTFTSPLGTEFHLPGDASVRAAIAEPEAFDFSGFRHGQQDPDAFDQIFFHTANRNPVELIEAVTPAGEELVNRIGPGRAAQGLRAFEDFQERGFTETFVLGGSAQLNQLLGGEPNRFVAVGAEQVPNVRRIEGFEPVSPLPPERGGLATDPIVERPPSERRARIRANRARFRLQRETRGSRGLLAGDTPARFRTT